MRKAIVEPPTPVRGGIGVAERGLNPDLAIANLDRTSWGVVGPQVEGAAAFEIETGVMPVTGDDPVLDAASVERETHMRASVIEREDATSVVDDQNRAVAAVNDDPALRLQFIKAACDDKFRVWRVHRRARGCKLGQRIGRRSANLYHAASF